MQRFVFYFLSIIVMIGSQWGPDYKDDLILKGRSDSAIKFLTPPMSLIVLQNRPTNGSYYFFIGDQKRLDGPSLGKLDQILSDSKTVKRTLLKTDPARLAPSKQGSDIRGPVIRSTLLNLAKEQPSDLLIIFRWEVRAETEGVKFINDEETSLPIELIVRGLVYISKQKKILAFPTLKQTGINPSELSQEMLKIFASKARNIIRAQKKIISDSY